MKLKNKLLSIFATTLLSCQYSPSPAYAQVVDNPLNAYGLELTLCESIADFAEEVFNLRQNGAKYEDVIALAHAPTTQDEKDIKLILDGITYTTWQYSNREELEQIIKALDNPIISGGGWRDEDVVKYLDSQEKDYGIVFYWSEYDDFSCYGDGFTHHIKVISGVKKA